MTLDTFTDGEQFTASDANAFNTAILRLARVTEVDLNDAVGDEQVLYTVPTGYTAIITHVIMHTASATAATGAGTFGIAGGATEEFRTVQQFDNLDGTTKYIVVYPDQGTHDTPEGGTVMTAAQVFAYEVTDQVAATCTMDVYGYLMEA